MFSGIEGVSSVFSSTVSKTEEVGARSLLDIIVRPKLQIIKSVATIAAKNIGLYSIAGLVFWLVGYNLAKL